MTSFSICGLINVIREENINLLYNTNMYYINKTLRNYNHKIKKEIDNDPVLWEKTKKYLNPYEYINQPYIINSFSVCSYKPISRSFFKMIEILNHYNFKLPNNMKSFHLAEGPGGFIEALSYYRNNIQDIYYGMTLIDKNPSIPKWKKNVQSLSNKNVILEYGFDKTGNLYNKNNLIYIYKKYKHSIDFITGDGGFDFSLNFNNQEENSLNLLFCQILFAISIQKKEGSFVLKVFDTYSSLSLELLYLLNYLYSEIYILKPVTSRPANSEKYIICLNFKMVENIDNIIEKMISQYDKINKNKITKILNIEISNLFLDKIKELYSIFAQAQNAHIQSIFNIMYDTNKNINNEIIKKNHIQKCIKWCKRFKMPINKDIINLY